MEQLQTLQKRRKRALAELEAWREKARGSMTAEAAALTDEEVNRLVHELR
jgi:hypothetical protein